jgi:peptidoglycan/LPS O-acetylase OafA/YrhL
VSVFFTLSGFLITSLILVERDHTGGISLKRFWIRRARRLIPASLLALLLALVVTATVIPHDQRVTAVGDIRAALLQFANWRFIAQGAKYADFGVTPSPVQHYWSLAIEEQFYVIFPIVAVVALRRRRAVLAGVFTALIGLSLLQQLTLTDIQHAYYGTDSRAAEIAVGGLLALGFDRIRRLDALQRWKLPDIVSLWALVGAVLIFRFVPQQRLSIYGGGLAAFSMLSAAMVLGSTEGHVFKALLSFRPLVYLGKISYGVYLYHFPLYILLDEDRVGVGGYALLGVRAAAAIGAAALSYHLYELPIRRGVNLKGRVAPVALAFGAAAVLLVGVPVSNSGHPRKLVFASVGGPSLESAASTTTVASSTTGSSVPGTRGPTTTHATIPPARPPRIVVVGDSTAAANGQGLEKWGQATGRIQAVVVNRPGCGVLPGKQFTIRKGYIFKPTRCGDVFTSAATAAENLDADAIVVFIGSSQLADWEYDDLQGLHRLGEPVIDERYSQAVQVALNQLEAAHRPILWATVPLPMWDLEVFSQTIGQPVPGEGPITLNDPPRTTVLNQLNDAAVPQSALAVLFPYAQHLMRADGTVPKSIRPDGLHLSDAGVATVADDWLFEVLGQAFRTVEQRAPGGIVPQERQSWSAPGAPLPTATASG